MRHTFDPAKNAVNIAAHGVSLTEAENLEWADVQANEDVRKNYGEERMIGYAVMQSRLYCVVYVDRGDERRIISLRKANNREVKRYG